jgi:hypothetical protein
LPQESAGFKPPGSQIAVQQKSSRRPATRRLRKSVVRGFYGLGEDVVVLTVVSVSVLVEGAGDSFTIVVLDSFFSPGGFVTVVSFCSQAESNAAPAKRQMYFFINQFDG